MPRGNDLTTPRYTMPRRPTGPRYWPTKKGFYTVIDGERVCLAKGDKDDPEVRDEADRQYHSIMLARQAQTHGDRAACVSVLDAFVEHCSLNRKKNTYDL